MELDAMFAPFLDERRASEEQFGPIREWFRAIEAELPGPQPWCRVCDSGVERWGWDRYADGFSGVWAECHGDQCGCLLWDRSVHKRVEAFCDQEPRLPGTRIWFVQWDGTEVQPSAEYIHKAIEGGRRSLPINRALRAGAPFVAAVGFVISTLIWWRYGR